MKDRKIILILGKLPPPYMGPAIATEIILKSALKDDYELLHLDTKINNSITSFGKWKFGKLRKNLSLYFKMFGICLKSKPDVVLIPISQTTVGFIKDALFILIAVVCRRKVIVQLRGSNFKNWISGCSGITKRFVKFVLRKTKGCIVLGNNLKYLFADYFPADKIFVVPNGADYKIPSKEKNGKEIKILYLSNLLASKGIADVFEATLILQNSLIETGKKEMQSEQINFSVDLIGEWLDEETKKYCLNLLDQNAMKMRVHSSEKSKDKLSYLAEADIFLFPPREPEGHPWSIVEAMAAGLPIISTDQGAIVESVIDGLNGFIVQPKNPEMIAQKLNQLIVDKNLREKMGNESRSLYLKNFTEEKMVANLSAAFNNVMEEK